jgi:hypothetical protein
VSIVETQTHIEKTELLEWLREQLAKFEFALKARKQMEEEWRGGTGKAWREVGCKLNKAQRLQASATHGRIAVKCLRDVEMCKAAIAGLSG